VRARIVSEMIVEIANTSARVGGHADEENFEQFPLKRGVRRLVSHQSPLIHAQLQINCYMLRQMKMIATLITFLSLLQSAFAIEAQCSSIARSKARLAYYDRLGAPATAVDGAIAQSW
jgi:hypothetical protein